MKKFSLTLIFCALTLIAKSQNTASVEKSIFGIQTGLLGVWVHNESKLSNQFALRSEVGLDAFILSKEHFNKDGLVFVPSITLEPRWYYNLNKRQKKSKRIDGNSGNFFSIATTYSPDWFTISTVKDVDVLGSIAIVPTWGMRRNIGKHFMYETGLGIGYGNNIDSNNVLTNDKKGGVVVNLNFRIGYRF